MLLFLLASAVKAGSAGLLLRNSAHGTALPLLCYALLASAAALGRCDPGHVLLNGLPLFLCGSVAMSFLLPRSGRYRDPDLDEGYYLALINVGTPQRIEEKVSELRAHPERSLLLPVWVRESCTATIKPDPSVISRLFLFPYRGDAAHTQNLPLCAYIGAHYRNTIPADPAHVNYGLWTPKTSAAW